MPYVRNFCPQHDDIIKWCFPHFPRYWPFVWGIHRSPGNKGQWRGALMFSLICVWINGWVNNREAGDLRRYRAHYDVIVMGTQCRGTARKKSFPERFLWSVWRNRRVARIHATLIPTLGWKSTKPIETRHPAVPPTAQRDRKSRLSQRGFTQP